MINLYCYHSPAASSVGFQEAGWTVKDGTCSVLPEALASVELRQAVREGGAKTLCADTGRKTRVFMLRGIFVRTGDQSGWRMNMILETDGQDYEPWADLTAAFLDDYKGMTEKLAGLFSEEYDGGKHYLLDKSGFEQMLRESAGTAQRFCDALKDESRSGGALLGSFAEELCRPFKPEAGRLLLLVPEASVGYFMGRTSLKGLTEPETCISEKKWSAFLAHELPEEELPEEELPEEGSRVREEKTGTGLCPLSRRALLPAGIVGAVLIVFMICRVLNRLKRKEE